VTRGPATLYNAYVEYGVYSIYTVGKATTMIRQRLRRAGNSYVVTIPKEEVERRGLREGQLLGIEITPLEVRPVLRRELREAVDERWAVNEPALRYLADH
jgi:antitoxin component of MazEF toxin-antitoxin module